MSDAASCPLGWRLFLPESWDESKAAPAAVRTAKAKQRKTLTNAPRAVASAAPAGRDASEAGDVNAGIDVEAVTAAARQRRRRCAVPEDEGHRPKWVLAIEMLDELAAQGLRPPVLAADAGYGDSSQFRAALNERGIVYSVQVTGDALAHTGRAAVVREGQMRAPTGRHDTGIPRRCRRQPGPARRRCRPRGGAHRHLARGQHRPSQLTVRVPVGPTRRAPHHPPPRREPSRAVADRPMTRRRA